MEINNLVNMMDVGKCSKLVFEEILCPGQAEDSLLCDRDAFGEHMWESVSKWPAKPY